MPSSGFHSMGFLRGAAAAQGGATTSAQAITALSTTALPASSDLSAYAPPVGDQGQVGSCAAWATGYYLRGWYARREGYFPAAGFAHMYTYAQISRGHDGGSTFQQNLDIQKAQGIDSRADYTQGDDNFTSQPTAAEIANAARFKIDSYEVVLGPGGSLCFSGPQQSWIESKLAGGDPVALSIPVYPELVGANATNYLVKNTYLIEAASIAPLSPLDRFFSGTTTTHWVTRNDGAVGSGYHYERTLGLLYARQQSGTVPLYGCLAAAGSNDHFVSPSSTCEGRVFLGVVGYLYSGWQLLTPTVQIYRCYRTVNGRGDHWVSTDSHCEGYTTEASLGYLRT